MTALSKEISLQTLYAESVAMPDIWLVIVQIVNAEQIGAMTTEGPQELVQLHVLAMMSIVNMSLLCKNCLEVLLELDLKDELKPALDTRTEATMTLVMDQIFHHGNAVPLELQLHGHGRAKIVTPAMLPLLGPQAEEVVQT